MKEQAEKEVQDLHYKNSFWSSAHRKGYSGVATFSHEQVDQVNGWGQSEYDSEGRIIISKTNKILVYETV